MSYQNNRALKRRPTHPGEFLREMFLPDYGLTVAQLAESLGVSRQSIYQLVRERRACTAEMALRLSRFFGNSADFWLNAQRAVELWEAQECLSGELARIKPIAAA